MKMIPRQFGHGNQTLKINDWDRVKSPAERQHEMRLRKHKKGYLRQLNLWIHADAHEILKSISLAKGKPMADTLREVLELQRNPGKTNLRSNKNTEKEISTQLELNFELI